MQQILNIVKIISVEDKALNKTIVEIIKIMRGICEKINGPSGKECIAVLDDIQQIILEIVRIIFHCNKLAIAFHDYKGTKRKNTDTR